MSEHSSGSSKPTFRELISVIDRAWEAKWALQLLQLLLFLDLAMIFAGQPGILGWDSEATPVLSNLSFVFITVVAFTLYAALLTPFASSIVAMIVVHIPKIFHSEARNHHPFGYVDLGTYKTDAYEKDDKDMIARYHDAVERNREAEAQQRQVGNILFGTLILILSNVFPNLVMIDTTNSILQNVMNLVGWEVGLSIAFFITFSMLSAINRAWFFSAERWIDHPKLYQELEAKRRKERAELGVSPFRR
ncbi:hypothetical protein [Vreelandella sp. EE7]